MVAHWKCGDSLKIWWLIINMVAHWICGGLLAMLWRIENVVTLGDMVAH